MIVFLFLLWIIFYFIIFLVLRFIQVVIMFGDGVRNISGEGSVKDPVGKKHKVRRVFFIEYV